MKVVLRPGEQVIVEIDCVSVHITARQPPLIRPFAPSTPLATIITSVDGHVRNNFKARPDEDVAVPDDA